MQQTQDVAEHIGGGTAHFRRTGAVTFGQRRLREFDEPVAERIPREAVAGGGILVEAVVFKRRAGLRYRAVHRIQYPARQRQACTRRIE